MASERPKPILQAMLLCDHLYQDRQSDKFVIAGPFTRVMATAFPAQHPTCYLYARLLDWQGKGTLRFRHLDLHDNSVLGESGPIPMEIKDRLTGFEFGIKIPPLVFPHPGPYAIDLLWGAENAPLGDWRYEAVLVKEEVS